MTMYAKALSALNRPTLDLWGLLSFAVLSRRGTQFGGRQHAPVQRYGPLLEQMPATGLGVYKMHYIFLFY